MLSLDIVERSLTLVRDLGGADVDGNGVGGGETEGITAGRTAGGVWGTASSVGMMCSRLGGCFGQWLA